MLAASFLHSSFLQAVNTVMLWLVRVEKVPQASEHLCPAKLQTRCDICCACQSICPFIPTDSCAATFPLYSFPTQVRSHANPNRYQMLAPSACDWRTHPTAVEQNRRNNEKKLILGAGISGHCWTEPTPPDLRGEQHFSPRNNSATELTSLLSAKRGLQIKAH